MALEHQIAPKTEKNKLLGVMVFKSRVVHTKGNSHSRLVTMYFLPSFPLTTTITAIDEHSLVCVEDQGRISWLGLTQDIKMGSCVFQCDLLHQWRAQRQVGPVSVYCDGGGGHVLCLQHGNPVWQHIGQSTTATSRNRRNMTSDV